MADTTEHQEEIQFPVVENFEILSVLGHGQSAMVYKARQLNLQRDVAIKVLKNFLDDDARKRFIQESKLMCRLDHPNIVKLLAVGLTAGGLPYICMEYFDAKTLSQILSERNHLSLKELKPVFLAILDGLEYAHDLGIVHRDLKPGNLIILDATADQSSIPKILDFGIAKALSDKLSSQAKTKTGQLVGTPAYMSPEMWRGDTLGPQTDLFSIALVLYECICGRQFYQADSLGDILAAQSKEFPAQEDFPPAVNRLLYDVLRKGLAKNVSDRFSTAAEMKKALSNALDSVDMDQTLSGQIGPRTVIGRAQNFWFGMLILLCGVAISLVFKAIGDDRDRKYALSKKELEKESIAKLHEEAHTFFIQNKSVEALKKYEQLVDVLKTRRASNHDIAERESDAARCIAGILRKDMSEGEKKAYVLELGNLSNDCARRSLKMNDPGMLITTVESHSAAVGMDGFDKQRFLQYVTESEKAWGKNSVETFRIRAVVLRGLCEIKDFANADVIAGQIMESQESLLKGSKASIYSKGALAIYENARNHKDEALKLCEKGLVEMNSPESSLDTEARGEYFFQFIQPVCNSRGEVGRLFDLILVELNDHLRFYKDDPVLAARFYNLLGNSAMQIGRAEESAKYFELAKSFNGKVGEDNIVRKSVLNEVTRNR